MIEYDPSSIEAKWEQRWTDARLHETASDPGGRDAFYCLEMLPYPSGRIHMGHVRNYSIGDVVARFQRMNGKSVMHVIGWDAFGLPAENAAIENQQNPATWTKSNIETMRSQFRKLGFSYDWSREFATCDPEYYRWNQWLFLKMYEKGIVYRAKRLLNWCDSCATTLANEQVVQGCCWRCDTAVEKREFEQWFLRISDHASSLLDELDRLDEWPERVRRMQQHWIGRSEGAEVRFAVEGQEESIEIFTTRLDTIYGCTYLALSAEHPLATQLAEGTSQETDVRAFIESQSKLTLKERFAEGTVKTGVDTGRSAIHPFTGKPIPIWLANFVLTDVGTGAVMSVPAHDTRDFEFAKAFGLPIRPVICDADAPMPAPETMQEARTEPGTVFCGSPYDRLPSEQAAKEMAQFATEKGFGGSTTNFRLKDWGVSRQRFWGTPIPMVHCADCGIVPVPERDLPIRLPEVDSLQDGGSPLGEMPEFVETKCPVCAAPARRETDTMDTFVDSSWYYFRYLDPENTKLPFDSTVMKRWLPVALYVGGIEHATMHLIYTRYWTRILRELGLVHIDEPIKRLFTQGMVTKDGAKMSKSKGNVVDPDAMVAKYGADTTRLFSLFAAPPERDLEWNEAGVEGCFRFLSRLWRLYRRVDSRLVNLPTTEGQSPDAAVALQRKAHKTIERVTGDIWPRMHFNTAVSAIMELTNSIADSMPAEDPPEDEMLPALHEAFGIMARLLAPFAPHLADELWSSLGNEGFVIDSDWPVADRSLLTDNQVTLVIQVNGKLRSRIQIERGADQDAVLEQARSEPNIAVHLEGKTMRKIIHVKDRLLNLVVS
jgi:leucyl-tRNA synthetase